MVPFKISDLTNSGFASTVVHFWANRSRRATQYLPQASAPLNLFSPLFQEQETDTSIGIAGGQKTLGKYYPDLSAGWLVQQISQPRRTWMLRKASTYLLTRLRRCVSKEL